MMVDRETVNKAVNALFLHCKRKGTNDGLEKQSLLGEYSKPVMIQVSIVRIHNFYERK